MANFRFFCDQPDGTTIESKKAHYDLGSNRKPQIWDEVSRSWVRATRVIEYKSFPSKHECDARCTGATGRIMKCECACGGKNHGKGA